ncbi:hypothetical protein LINPERHAP1_LOCUS17152 [Linum perenne]
MIFKKRNENYALFAYRRRHVQFSSGHPKRPASGDNSSPRSSPPTASSGGASGTPLGAGTVLPQSSPLPANRSYVGAVRGHETPSSGGNQP